MPKSILQRLSASLAREGVRGAAARLHRFLLEYWFDFRNGVDTRKTAELFQLKIRGENAASGTRYAPTRVSVLRALFTELADLFPPESILLDIGCGKGRALLLAAEAGFREAHGVEFAHELCEIATRNCAVYARRSRTGTRLSVHECDALSYPIQNDENVFYIANP
ncbi:MAG TPA: class I SAM-dependent methyltransferase, partial [Chthoniobacteraceae bacterium]